jgi:hypothetical protein
VTVTVHQGAEPLFMVKLGKRDARGWMEREILCCRAIDAGAGRDRITPALVHSDLRAALLVTVLIDPALTLHDCLDAPDPDAPGLIDGFAAVLARLHAVALPASCAVPPVLPWVLAEDSQDRDANVAELFPEPAGRDDILRMVVRSARLWQGGALIHGDAKLDNGLVVGRAADGVADVRLVDWELGGLGDPAWDLATALQEFMILALTSAAGPVPVDAMLGGPAGRAMAQLHQRYLRDRALQTAEAEALEQRVSVFVAARMVQSAFEFAAFEGAEGHRAQGARALALDLTHTPDAIAGFLRRTARDAVSTG